MVINMHEHPGRYALEHQAEEGIDVSVLLPVGEEAQRTAVEQAGESPERFVAFTWPGYCEQWDEAAATVAHHAEEFGCRGVKFQPLPQLLYL